MDIMVDLETWGTTPGSDIRSIGAVVFDPVAGTLGDEFYVATENPVRPDARPAFSADTWDADRKYPVYRDPRTVQWWSDQSAEAQAGFCDRVDLRIALTRFAVWWAERCPGDGEGYTRFWAHGPHFDEVILAGCYRATELTVPWHYRAPRDLRTMLEAAGMDPKTGIPDYGTAHNALDDAKAQALGVIEAYRRLGYRPRATDFLQEVLQQWDDESKYHDLYHSIETFLSEIHA